ncbi:MAG TPA: type II toxin-antitoxin system RelE/ParE family toxin [Phycisphaerae bacterium]|nr:type II toxin-antitoxin system RelE/ParE family toxin [Phycisphaerae bacterium]
MPLLDWLDRMPDKVRIKCIGKIGRLQGLGFELLATGRQEAAYLGSGIYELRVRRRHVNYRMLYFFQGRTAVVISHGTTKERRVEKRDIQLAVRRKGQFEGDPSAHTARMADLEPDDEEDRDQRA